MQYDSSMAIAVSNPVRRPPYCVNRNVRCGSQGTHRDVANLQELLYQTGSKNGLI